MGQAPDERQLTHDIESTRSDLTRDVDALADKVSPTRVMERRVEATKGRLSGVRDSVMGSAHDASGSASDATSATTTAVKERTQGNPMAAGVIAFGAGWLLSSLLPASDAEQRAAAKVEEVAREHGQPVVDQAKEAGQQVGAHMKEQATGAAQEVKASAQDSAATVQQQGQAAKENVVGETRSQADDVRQS